MARNEAERRIVFVDDLPPKFSITVEKCQTLHLNIASFQGFADSTIEVIVKENGTIEGAFADFSQGNGKFVLNVRLLGEGSKCRWHLACLDGGLSQKDFETSVYHEAPHTEALMSNYGIARDAGRLVFAGTSEIKKGSVKVKTRQESKIIVFDQGAIGRASPILRIGDNDVEASHAAIVGRLNSAHLFYLESRGISEEEAKRLITLGYLRPIEDSFVDESLVAKIESAIEGGIQK
ncbi:MAG: SufD family Fe-S cluster assembly protein [Bacilli bacterium]|jgi:Fe-S cluster assembly protein SufD|nr:SufD family Fe-S cluster assembly protein [Bacilli bacterium]